MVPTSEANKVHTILPMQVAFMWTDRGCVSPRKLLGGEIPRLLLHMYVSRSYELSNLPNRKGGIVAYRAAGCKLSVVYMHLFLLNGL